MPKPIDPKKLTPAQRAFLQDRLDEGIRPAGASESAMAKRLEKAGLLMRVGYRCFMATAEGKKALISTDSPGAARSPA